MPLYDTIGCGYAKTRPADDRIVSMLVASLALPPGSTILDIGAGTGKYSRALADRGYSVIAIEPSEVMRAQSMPHDGVRWVTAAAEEIPLRDNSADGAFVVLALHHFLDRARALQEIMRIIGVGPLVIFTFEPSGLSRFWLADYFPILGREIRSSFSDLKDVAGEVETLVPGKVTSVAFPLPRDLKDKFAAAVWATPESYLDPEVRNGMSSFQLMRKEEVEEGVKRLKADLATGRWDASYGALRSQESYDAGYKFIISRRR
jgi:SAM-dependent methyltransferase